MRRSKARLRKARAKRSKEKRLKKKVAKKLRHGVALVETAPDLFRRMEFDLEGGAAATRKDVETLIRSTCPEAKRIILLGELKEAKG